MPGRTSKQPRSAVLEGGLGSSSFPSSSSSHSQALRSDLFLDAGGGAGPPDAEGRAGAPCHSGLARGPCSGTHALVSTPAVPPLSGLLVSVPTLATGQRSSGLRTGCVRRWAPGTAFPGSGSDPEAELPVLPPSGHKGAPGPGFSPFRRSRRNSQQPRNSQLLEVLAMLLQLQGRGSARLGGRRGGGSCAYPDPVPEVSSFSVGKSFQLSTLRFHCSWGGESRLNEPLFSFFPFFARTLPASPRLDLKCLFSSASPGL